MIVVRLVGVLTECGISCRELARGGELDINTVDGSKASGDTPPAGGLPKGELTGEATPFVSDLKPAGFTIPTPNKSVSPSTTWTSAGQIPLVNDA